MKIIGIVEGKDGWHTAPIYSNFIFKIQEKQCTKALS
jgi:hypothetical protein